MAREGRTGFFAALGSAFAGRGLRGLFRGAGARVLFFAPSMSVSMACFETAKGLVAEL